MADVFISYKREEISLAQRVARVLSEEGYSSFFDAHDEHGINIGETWDRRLERELMAAAAVVVLWSPRAAKSDNVRDEARRAAKARRLVPARVAECDVPLGLGTLQTADLSRWTGSRSDPEWRMLVDRGVARLVGRPATLGGQSAIGEADPRPHRRWLLVGSVSITAAAGIGYLWVQSRSPASSVPPRLAVLAQLRAGVPVADEMRLVTDVETLLTQQLNSSNRFRIVDVAEVRQSLRSNSPTNVLVDAGRTIGADYFILVSLEELGLHGEGAGETVFPVYSLRILDLSNERVLRATVVEPRDRVLRAESLGTLNDVAIDAFREVIDTIAPASIVKLEPITINRGRHDGIGVGDLLLVERSNGTVRDGDRAVHTVRVLVGTARVQSVSDMDSVVEMTGAQPPRIGDLVTRR